MSNVEHIYSIADSHAQTVQVCIDRLHKLGANEQLKRLTGRLQKLAVRAAPGDDNKDTKAARRQRGGIKGRNQSIRGRLTAKGLSSTSLASRIIPLTLRHAPE